MYHENSLGDLDFCSLYLVNTETGRKAYECLGDRECSIKLIGDLWNKYI